MSKDEQLIEEMNRKFRGDNEEIVKKIIEAVGGKDKFLRLAEIWFGHHIGHGLFVLFGTACSAGYKIAKAEE